jgi:hypothetical protein
MNISTSYVGIFSLSGEPILPGTCVIHRGQILNGLGLYSPYFLGTDLANYLSKKGGEVEYKGLMNGIILIV